MLLQDILVLRHIDDTGLIAITSVIGWCEFLERHIMAEGTGHKSLSFQRILFRLIAFGYRQLLQDGIAHAADDIVAIGVRGVAVCQGGNRVQTYLVVKIAIEQGLSAFIVDSQQRWHVLVVVNSITADDEEVVAHNSVI